MIKMILKKIIFWLECSRIFSLPMTVMSWLIVFLYALKQGGNIVNGLFALVGIAFAHLATNLFDDYLDYKVLCKDETFINSAQKCKCEYIKNGAVTLPDVLCVVIFYCSIALVTGIYLTFRVGISVVGLGLIGGIITLLYAKLSRVGLSELAVGIAFGPLLFEGTYYVMTGNFSFDVLILSIAVVMFTIGLLYTHTLLDFDGDLTSHKKTLCIRIGDKTKALKLLVVILVVGYLMTGILAIKSQNYLLFMTFLTTPWAIFLYKYMTTFNIDKSSIPTVHWWNYPLDNWANLKTKPTAPFYFRLFQARNLMMYYSVLLCVAIVFGD